MSDEKMMPCPDCPYCGKPMMAHETDWSDPPTWSFHCMCISAQGFLTREAAYAAYSVRAALAHPPQAREQAIREAAQLAMNKAIVAARVSFWAAKCCELLSDEILALLEQPEVT